MPRKLNDFFFDRTVGKRAVTEHERAVDACIPEAVGIANKRIKRDLIKKPYRNNPEAARKMANRHFLEAMDEITARKGLRVFARQGRREILFRKFDLQGGGK